MNSFYGNLEGQQINEWNILKYVGDKRYLCQCSCENKTQKVVTEYSLLKGTSKSCGCLRKKLNSASKLTDLTGKKFGEWEVLEYLGSSKWLCRCSCGKERAVKAQSLKSGVSTSCGHNTTGFKDLSNQQFGELTALNYKGNHVWECRCSCGKIVTKKTQELTSGKAKSCGHIRVSSKKIDITGETFGELKVIKYVGGERWLCQCSCGNTTVKLSHSLRRSSTISCGCKELKPYTKEEIIHIINEYLNETGELPFRYDLEILLDRAKTSIARYIQRYNLYEYINKTYKSRQEKELHELFPTKHIGVRNILNGYELDLYYPEHNLAIEFNGNYWHSEDFKESTYHQAKSLECMKNNIEIIHIFEYEWSDKDTKERLINTLKNKLCSDRNIKTTKNEIVEIAETEDNNKITITALNKNQDTIGKIVLNRVSNYEFEVDNNSIESNQTEINKLIIDKFIENHNKIKLISRVDFSKSIGKKLTDLGFSLTNITEPSCKWWISGESIVDDNEIQDILDTIDLDTLDDKYDLLNLMGYKRIYDCGYLEFMINKF